MAWFTRLGARPLLAHLHRNSRCSRGSRHRSKHSLPLFLFLPPPSSSLEQPQAMATLSTSAALKESMRRRATVAGRALTALAAVPGAFLRLLVKPSAQVRLQHASKSWFAIRAVQQQHRARGAGAAAARCRACGRKGTLPASRFGRAPGCL